MTGRTETFSFLPPMTPQQIGQQIEHMLNQKHIPIIEFSDNPNCEDLYWKTWPIPPKADITPSWVVAQLEACARRNPYAQVRISGYCPTSHRTGLSFVVRAPMEQAV